MAKQLADLPFGAKVKYPAGKYNGQTVIFQVGARNHPGYPAESTTVIPERILSIKAFDAKEPANTDTNRRNYGNNRYAQSNLRQWLNKEGAPWYSAQHGADQAPNAANLNGSWNPYDTEAGFLSGFPREFIDAIMPTTLTVVKASVDGGGTETVTDKVFLPSTTEVGLANEGAAEGSKWPLFTDNTSRLANPTAQAVSASNYTNSSLNANSPWYWWLRTPTSGNSHYVRNVHSSGALSYSIAFNGNYGVRPALNLPSRLAVSDVPDSDGAYVLGFNEAPKITGPSTALGNKTGPFGFTVQITDKENDAVNIVEKLNGTVIRTEDNIKQGVDRELKITNEQWATIPLNQESTYVIEATDAKGNKTTVTYRFTKTNAAPTATAVEPRGDLSNIGIVDTQTPIFVWSFTDPDPGDKQSAYQFIIENTQDEVIHDSGKKTSTQSFYQLPEDNKLAWGTRYKWRVKVWDRFDIPSEDSFPEFIMPNRPPNVSNVLPGSNDKENPAGAGLNPEVAWDFEDLDLEAQAAYQVKIYKSEDDALVYDSSRIGQNVHKHQVPTGRLSQGVAYYTVVTVWDPNGLKTDSEKSYFRTNATPSAPILTGPVDNYRTTLKPTLIGIVGTDPEDDGMHFRIQISTDPTFEKYAFEKSSEKDRAGWQVNGYDIPEVGVKNDQQGQSVAYTMQVDLDYGKTYYWRMASVDAGTGARGVWSSARRIRAGNELIFEIKNPVNTANTAARRILFAADYQLPTDGTTKATLKVEFANNALDVSPTWEDATDAFLSMDYHDFTNGAKTAGEFAIGVRMTIKANDSMAPIGIEAIGLTFD